MLRTFELDLPLLTDTYNVLTLCLAEPGAIPTDGYFPNPCAGITITAKTSTFQPMDSLGAGPTGQTSYSRQFDRNVFDLGQLYLKGAASPSVVIVEIFGK